MQDLKDNLHGITRHGYQEQEQARRNHQRSRTKDTFEPISSGKRRILCPWNDDDSEKLQKFRKRVKSAPVVLNSPAIQHKPGFNLSRSRTTLSLLNEFDLERSTVTQRKGQKFMQRSMPDRYMQAYIHHQQNTKKIENDKINNRLNSGKLSFPEQGDINQIDRDKIKPPDLARPQDQSAPRSSRVLSPLSGSSRSTLNKGSLCGNPGIEKSRTEIRNSAFQDETSSMSVTKLPVQSRRLSGPKLYSPAGFLDTTEKFHTKPHKLPTLLINDVYKGRNYSET